MNLTRFIRLLLLLSVCCFSICSTTPVNMHFYDEVSDLSDPSSPLNWPAESYERLEEASEVKRDAPLRHVASVLRHKHHRKEMSKRRFNAKEILQLLRQASESRGVANNRGRWKSMRFGVSRKRSIPDADDQWARLPQDHSPSY